MKTLLLISALFFSPVAGAQQCHCSRDSSLEELISCKPVVFSNHARLYWSYNCDSSWLTFKSPAGKKKILFSLGGGLVDLTNRLGYVDFAEFGSSFLVTNNVISGCCDPQDYYVHDKTSGRLIKYLGRALFISDDKKFPFVISLTNSKYPVDPKKGYTSLTVYNLDSRKEFRIALPKGDVETGMKNNAFMFAEYLFDDTGSVNGKLTLRYYTEALQQDKEPAYKTVVIDLNKYLR